MAAIDNFNSRFLRVLIIAFAISVSIGIAIQGFPHNQDIGAYYRGSGWVEYDGALYIAHQSEYPLLANLIFALVRYATVSFGGGFILYAHLFIAGNAVLLTLAIGIILNAIKAKTDDHLSMLAIMTWLNPFILQHMLLRYDLYPMLASFLMLYYLDKKHVMRAAFFLGLAIALKGYAIAFVPIFLRYSFNREQMSKFILSGVIIVTPSVVMLGITGVISGTAGVLSPFEFHARRELNPESIYFILNRIFDLDIGRPAAQSVAVSIFASLLLISLAIRTRNIKQFSLVALGLLISALTLSLFYSSQFVLWLLPFALYTQSRAIHVAMAIYSLATGVWILSEYDVTAPLFDYGIVFVTACRIVMIVICSYEIIQPLRTHKNMSQPVAQG